MFSMNLSRMGVVSSLSRLGFSTCSINLPLKLSIDSPLCGFEEKKTNLSYVMLQVFTKESSMTFHKSFIDSFSIRKSGCLILKIVRPSVSMQR